MPRDGDKLWFPPSPYCEQCGHTGLIPLIKNNKIIPNAWLFCECRQKKNEEEHYQRRTPADFDFPVSYDFYRSIEATYGKGDPGLDEAIGIGKPEKPMAVQRLDQLQGKKLKAEGPYKGLQIESSNG